MSSIEYRQILKTSAITGVSRAVGIVAGFARNKIIAVYAGPAGIGMLALFSSTTALISTATSLGLGSSAVRSIAAAATEPDSPKVAETIIALRRICWMTGLLGTSLCAIFSGPISRWTFGTDEHAAALALLSLTILIGQLSTGQTALLRGLRKVRQLASGSIFAALASVAMAAAWIGTLGLGGIVPFVLSLAVINLAGTWWYTRKVKIAPIAPSWSESMGHGREMLALGLSFLASSGFTAGATYLIGVVLFQTGDAHLNGLYQAAWSCSGALVGFVLAAMGQDFYPRLTAAVAKREDTGNLINSQAEVGILLALPGLVAMAGLTPVILPLLFSKEFSPAQAAMPWFVMGSFGRVVSWPIGFYFVAAGEKRWFLFTEFATNALHVAAVYLLADRFGIQGAGAAFLGIYIFYTLMILLIIRRLSGFSPSARAVRYALLGWLAIALAALVGVVAGCAIALLTTFICARSLLRKLGPDSSFARKVSRLPWIGRHLAPSHHP